MNSQELRCLQQLGMLALLEDFGAEGDVTSLATIPATQQGRANFVARRQGVLAGIDAARWVARQVDASLVLETHVKDGTPLQRGDVIATVSGSMRAILMAERTALNFLQRLSGVATLTRQFVDAVAGTKASILDTRKTTPGWRLLEKYAVRMGGGTNHRIGLFDAILVKDNHLAGVRHEGQQKHEIEVVVDRCRERYPHLAIEVEVDSLEQLDVALRCPVAIVLLDNMTNEQMRLAVARRDAKAPSVLLEASGGVNLHTVRGIAETGVDRISVGAITHSATALDIALDEQPL